MPPNSALDSPQHANVHLLNNHRSYENLLITSIVLIMAQATTACLMFKFYKDIQEIDPIMIIEQEKHFNRILKNSL
ncbi:hypothetical protein BJV40_003286 [Clostridium beijerinckii]|nr:hypothetical protein [Clostridium beijerinckii]